MKLFIHDCDACRFLGSVKGPDPYHLGRGKRWDLYFCGKSESFMGGTVIARYGSDGSNYLSSPRSILQRDIGHHPALRWGEALLQMEERKK